MLIALHHIQLAMPQGAEDQAAAFYAGILGMTPVPKPEALAGRGGVWFESGQFACIWVSRRLLPRPERRIRPFRSMTLRLSRNSLFWQG